MDSGATCTCKPCEKKKRVGDMAMQDNLTDPMHKPLAKSRPDSEPGQGRDLHKLFILDTFKFTNLQEPVFHEGSKHEDQ